MILIKNICNNFFLSGEKLSRFSILIDDCGNVEKIGDIPENDAYKCIDAEFCYVSPGWVDVHTHIYKGVCDIGIDPDLIGPKTGVSTLIDAGSSGCVTFTGLRDYIIKKKDYPIYEFLNYGVIGITRCNIICDYETDDFVEPDETLRCIEDNRDIIRGLKLRACKVVFKGRGIPFVRDAEALAREAKVPMMVHVGEPEPYLGDILDVLGSGDVVTHCFNGKPGNILDPHTGKIIIQALKARDRGVLFDVGHGCASYDTNIGKAAIKQGFKPDMIGSDLHGHSYPNPVRNLPVTMSKMCSSGLSVEEILRAVTITAKNMLRIPLGIQVGEKASFTLFKIIDKQVVYRDVYDNPIDTHVQFIPLYTIVGDTVFACEG
ncbi:amidohydrolase family protein [uncultured Sphaerochaeta sp.]|uniref:amidohydrolase family protein n=1 Tax=uncultured Sphaerochaeta sp. TaxID=886478 RepID=UPI002A0A8522|nr:amidohydrolase family protein [uncultured Sphaerochaeta sp.]